MCFDGFDFLISFAFDSSFVYSLICPNWDAFVDCEKRAFASIKLPSKSGGKAAERINLKADGKVAIIIQM